MAAALGLGDGTGSGASAFDEPQAVSTAAVNVKMTAEEMKAAGIYDESIAYGAKISSILHAPSVQEDIRRFDERMEREAAEAAAAAAEAASAEEDEFDD